MTQDPPFPYMSNWNDLRPTHGRPTGSRIPDVVIVNDGSKPPIQSNIREVVEIKFPGDDWSEDQQADYEEIAGNAPLTVLSPEKCGCPDKPKMPPVPVTVPKKQETEEKNKQAAYQGALVPALIGLALIAGMLLAPEIEVPVLMGTALAF